jgi:hypothetical protein
MNLIVNSFFSVFTFKSLKIVLQVRQSAKGNTSRVLLYFLSYAIFGQIRFGLSFLNVIEF